MTDHKPAATPPVPKTLHDTGLNPDQIEQLLVKTLYVGEATGLIIADRMRLPFTILEPIIERLRAERQMEVRGAGGAVAASYRYGLTDLGRDRAQQYFSISRYVGPAPVPLDTYVAAMNELQAGRGHLDHDRLAKGFSHLIVRDEVLEQLGPAVNAGKAVFLYGPPGNGKTVLAEGMGRSLGGDMYIPHAIDVDGHTITLYDPIAHEAIDGDESEPASVIVTTQRDRRWMHVRRPVVMVGGELTLDMLDLTFNPIAKFYEAPIHMKANGGVFLVDDFGRQRIRPEELLNRWIVPLENRIDYLTLHTGKKFQVPFDVLVVFATNLNPESLADEAFLRRIPYKIPVTDPSIEEFTKIFELNCRRRKLRFHQVMALCRYRGVEPAITRELLDKACQTYFVDKEPQ